MGENSSKTISKQAETNQQIQFTGIVVTYNEARRLPECLKSLAFCDQLLIIDLGSEDDSVRIANQYGATVINHDRVEVVEEIRTEAISFAVNDWVVFLDPDEVLPKGIESHLRSLIKAVPFLGVIRVPWQFYFRGEPLNVTIWGRRQKTKGVVCHQERNTFTPHVHQGRQLLNGFISETLSYVPEHTIKHYWVDSYSQMYEKHWRYIKKEGEARYHSGERFLWNRWLKKTLRAIKQNLIDYHGWRGGCRGIFLSVFYAWYVNMSLLSLRQYQKKMEKSDALSDLG